MNDQIRKVIIIWFAGTGIFIKKKGISQGSCTRELEIKLLRDLKLMSFITVETWLSYIQIIRAYFTSSFNSVSLSHLKKWKIIQIISLFDRPCQSGLLAQIYNFTLDYLTFIDRWEIQEENLQYVYKCLLERF